MTIQTPEKDGSDRIRFNEHDIQGAKQARKVCKRLKLDSQPDNSPLRVDINNLFWLIKKHLILIQDVSKMRAATIEKYFFNADRPGKEFLKLIYIDAISTIPEDGKTDLSNFYTLINRIDELDKLHKEKDKLPPPILDGNEIMEKFNIKPGPEVGAMLDKIREAQLQGKIGQEKSENERKKRVFEYLEKEVDK